MTSRALHQVCELLQLRRPRDPDWKAILKVANANLITPRLHRCVAEAGMADIVPEGVAAFLSDVHERNRARNEALHRMLLEMLATLNAVGVEPVLLKGAALWALLGRRPDGDRMLSDIDLLVRPDELAIAVEALKSKGFDHFHPPTADVVALARPSDVGLVDVHARPPGPAAFVYGGDIHAASAEARFGALRARVPPAALQIFISAIHDQFHDGHYLYGGFNLTHLLDICDLAPLCGAEDWRRLLEYCNTAKVRDGVGAQLLAAHRLVGADIPVEIISQQRSRLTFWRLTFQAALPPLDWAIRQAFLLKWRLTGASPARPSARADADGARL